MVPDFLCYENGIEEGKNDKNTPDNSAVTPDDEINDERPLVTNHGLYNDPCEGENRRED
jgi:hypothetical protein